MLIVILWKGIADPFAALIIAVARNYEIGFCRLITLWHIRKHSMSQCVLAHCFFVTQEVKQLIHAALARYSADRIGKFDFALENVGGVVLSDKCSKTFSPSLATVSLFGFPLWHITSSPRAIIQVRVRSVGEMNILRAPRCWMLIFLSHVMNLSVCKGFIMIYHSSLRSTQEIAGLLKEVLATPWSR